MGALCWVVGAVGLCLLMVTAVHGEYTSAVDAEKEDYQVQVQQVMTDMVEVRWDPVTAGETKFQLIRDGQEKTYNQVTVTCAKDSKGCQGYFIHLDHKDYTISVSEYDDPGKVVARETSTLEDFGPLTSITMHRFIRIASEDSTAKLKITFTELEKDPNAVSLTYFSMVGKGDQVTYYSDSSSTTDATFSMEILSQHKKTMFILAARDKNDAVWAVGRLAFTPKDLGVDLYGLKNGDEYFSFRAVSEVLSSYFMESQTDPSDRHECEKFIGCYHMAKKNNQEVPMVCAKRAVSDGGADSTEAEQCDTPKEVKSSTEDDVPDDLVITLTRHKDGSGSMPTISETTSVTTTTDAELVTYASDDDSLADVDLCTSDPLQCSEDLKSDPEGASFNVLTYSTSDTWWNIDFKDYQLDVQQLMEDMVEARWDYTGENDIEFQLTCKNKANTNQVFVKCGTNPLTCKGYFFNLAIEDYEILVCEHDVKEEDGCKKPGNIVARETLVAEHGGTEKITLKRVTKTKSGALQIKYRQVSTAQNEESVVGLGVLQIPAEGPSVSSFFTPTTPPVVEDGNNVIASFELPPEALKSGSTSSLVLTLRTGLAEEVTAAGALHFSVPDYSSVALNFIGGDVSAIRAKSSLADFVEVNKEPCHDLETACYFLGVKESDTVTVCKEFEDDIEYCEEKSARKTSPEEESPKMLLTRDMKGQDRATLTLLDIGKDPPKTIELVAYDSVENKTTYYSPSKYACEIKEDRCTQVLQTAPKGDSFKIIVSHVRSDNLRVYVMTFKDFSLSANQFSNNTLKAEWEPLTNTSMESISFITTLRPSTGGADEESLTVPCGAAGKNTRCRAYFVRREAGEYTVRIRQDGDETNQVACTMTMESVTEGLSFTQVHNKATGPDSLKLTVFFKNAPAGDYDLVVVDSKGVWVSTVSTPTDDGTATDSRAAGLEQHHEFDLDTRAFDIYDAVWAAVRTSGGSSGAADVRSLLLMSLDQVGEGAIEVHWTNTGDSYVIDELHNVECGKLSSSPSSSSGLCHFVLHKPYPDYQDATVEVVDQGALLQKASRVTYMQSLDGMELSTPTLRYDYRVQVCFKDEDATDSDTYYHLVIEDGDRLLQMANVSEVENVGDLKCLFSPTRMEVGAFVSSWVLVARLDGNKITRAGDTDWTTFLLSAKRHVRAAFNSKKELHVSWNLLEEFNEDSGQYRLTVRKPGGVAFQEKFTKNQTSHTLPVTEEGSYTACVKAMVKDFGSEEICSPIVVLDMSVQVSGITEPEAFSSGGTSAMISWEPVKDANGYFVKWQESSRNKRTRESYVVPPLVKGNAFPSLLVRAVDGQTQNFVMVPQGVSTLKVDGLSDGNWNICVAAVKDDMVGEEKWSSVSLDSNSDRPKPPEELLYEDNTLCWTPATKDDSMKYFVTWILTDRPESLANHDTYSNTCIPFQPEVGRWAVSVLALSENNIASEPREIEITIKGIIIRVDQVGARSLRVSWRESETAPDMYNYILTLKKPGGGEVFSGKLKCKSCDQDNPCFHFVMDIGKEIKELDVFVERIGVQRERKTVTFYEFEEVKMRYELRSSHNATISWSPVKGAKEYNVSFFKDHTATKLIQNAFVEYPTSYQFATEDFSIKDAYSTVQPCKDKTHCGARTGAWLKQGKDGPSNFTTVLGSVLGVLGVSLIVLIVLVTYRYQRKKASSTSSSEVELSPRDVPSFGTEPRHQQLQGRPSRELPGFVMWR